MPSVPNIHFKDNWQGGPDLLTIEFHFEAEELSHLYTARIGYRHVAAGKPQEPWQELPALDIEPKQSTFVETLRPDISKTSGFQQQVQFKVILFRAVASMESGSFPLRS